MFGSTMLVGCLLLAQTAVSNDDLKLEVRKLVRQLDSVEKARREAAVAQLIAIGLKQPAVLELLPQPTQQGIPAGVLELVGQVRQKLQRTQAESAAEPSIVT